MYRLRDFHEGTPLAVTLGTPCSRSGEQSGEGSPAQEGTITARPFEAGLPALLFVLRHGIGIEMINEHRIFAHEKRRTVADNAEQKPTPIFMHGVRRKLHA